MVGGTTFGYCATGSENSDTPPITIMSTASTFARTGRSMKNFEIMMRCLLRSGLAGRSGLHGRRFWRLQLRIDLLTGDGVLDAGDHDALVRLQAAFDHAHRSEGLAELHP